MKKWQRKLDRAHSLISEAAGLVSEAARDVMSEKGFSERAVGLFGANIASGHDTVVMFNGGGEMADLDTGVAAGMTKEEIIYHLSRYGELTDEDIEILNE